LKFSTSLCLASVLALFVAESSRAGDTAPETGAKKARVFFVEPADGAKVPAKFTVKMGVEGMEVAPAGTIKEGTGHHHILIDRKPLASKKVVPTSATAIHFGKGQTETELTLAPGKHSLTLQFADGNHQSYGPDLSATIHVEVEAPAKK
jgi:hypothetical protein